MTTPEDSLLGRGVAYPSQYDPALLFPIPRAPARAALGLDAQPPFTGHDRWQAYELSWLDARGKPVAATATITVPAGTPHLVESKSLKLYLNSLNAERFDRAEAVRRRIAADLSQAAGGPVEVRFGLPPLATDDDDATCIDDIDIAIDRYGPPDAALLHPHAGEEADEVLRSHLLKSNCPV